ncbi:tetratricopeptide repeat protein [Altericista sp. CCNU0014]|uniref:tetratricopeptide repeat protein n=1 Tax=Altericista sp. CCNU0014 TaxID=3082949 RepID=UPI00384E24DF
MIDSIEAALQGGNYPEVTRLLGTLNEQDPWTQFYWARLWETTQESDRAEAAYRNLLRQADSPKLTLAARQGLERLQTQRTQARKQAIAEAIAEPHNTEPGVLVLAAIDPAQKTEAAQAMAKIMNIEPYSARMLLPSRGIRLYRTGAVGELEFYGRQLNDCGIPAFWLPLSLLQSVTVHSIQYFESVEGIVRAIVQSDEGGPRTLGAERALQFAWTDIAARVEGQLPIFEEVVDRDARGKLLRKEKTQDRANFCDLHLPAQNCILRISDAAYQFNRGERFESEATADFPLNRSTAWANWRQLSLVLSQKLSQQPVWATFEPFAETAFEHPDLLSKLPSHINLFRREDSNWDPAFQLYSALLFLKSPDASLG